jgi:hypothetical protein
MEKVVLQRDRPTKEVKLPSTGITIEIYASLLMSDAEALNTKELLSGSMSQTKILITKLIKKWNWYETADALEPLPVTPENVGMISADDIPIITTAIEEFQREQKKN